MKLHIQTLFISVQIQQVTLAFGWLVHNYLANRNFAWKQKYIFVFRINDLIDTLIFWSKTFHLYSSNKYQNVLWIYIFIIFFLFRFIENSYSKRYSIVVLYVYVFVFVLSIRRNSLSTCKKKMTEYVCTHTRQSQLRGIK